MNLRQILKINIFTKDNIRYLVYVFLGLQMLSIIASIFPLLSYIIFILLIFVTIVVSWQKLEYGFLILVFEFLAGHGGHLFEFMGVSIRSAIFITIMVIWFLKKIQAKDFSLNSFLKSPVLLGYVLFLFFIFCGFLNGLFAGHGVLAFKDLINYSFFLLLLPLLDLVKKEGFLKRLFIVVTAGIIGIAIETFFVFLLFAFGFARVHDVFYWWWRDTAIGKATFTKDNFFRIVTPVHLFVLPVFITYISLFFSKFKNKFKKKKSVIILGLLSSFCLLLNFSRAYFLGILFGVIALKKNIKFKKWLGGSILIFLVMILQFSLLFGIASGGDLLGGSGFLGKRIQTLTKPQDELSSLTRLVILPDLLSNIYQSPMFGTGLGAKVGYPDPLSGEYKHTFHIDWGYLEIWLELGFLGLIVYFSLLIMIFFKGLEKAKKAVDPFKKRLFIGISAGLLALFVASLGGPFLFHPLGILYIIISLALVL
ncbi:MAG TPA: O-antigen ligase family protein [Patescibacteria group bacterium]|nr:O-antigen ligase family protein [Patescibacteria group bacterium]